MFASSSSAQTSLLEHFLANCGNSYFAGNKPDVTGLEPSQAQGLDGKIFYDLSNGYSFAVTDPSESVSSCSIVLRFSSIFQGNLGDDVVEFLNWADDRKAEGRLHEVRSLKEEGYNLKSYLYRTSEPLAHCPFLMLGYAIDEPRPKPNPEILLMVGTYEGTLCRTYFGS